MDKENILKCAGCDQIKVGGIWVPNNGILSEDQLLKCPTVVCTKCRPQPQK